MEESRRLVTNIKTKSWPHYSPASRPSLVHCWASSNQAPSSGPPASLEPSSATQLLTIPNTRHVSCCVFSSLCLKWASQLSWIITTQESPQPPLPSRNLSSTTRLKCSSFLQKERDVRHTYILEPTFHSKSSAIVLPSSIPSKHGQEEDKTYKQKCLTFVCFFVLITYETSIRKIQKV